MSAAPAIEDFVAGVNRSPEKDPGAIARSVRAYLGEVRSHLEVLHRSALSGRRVNEANSDLMDRLVRRLFRLAEEEFLAERQELQSDLCVVAVGGYARREMSIHSDIDLLVLYRDEVTPYVTRIAERLQYWLWDGGLVVGCATRTISDTLGLANEDVTVKTAVLMARFLSGDGVFFHEFSQAIHEKLLPEPIVFADAQIQAVAERHHEMGESLFLLQPNVKEGVGALRDYHAAYWVLRATEASARDADDFLHFGLLTEAEMLEYGRALEFLWVVRNELHLRAGRRQDQMGFELQEQIAEVLGYASKSADGKVTELPVEQFMGDYYRHARAIKTYSEMAIEQARARAAGESTEARAVEKQKDCFRLVAGHLEISSAAALEAEPERLLSAFRTAQEWDVPLSRTALRFVRESLDLVDDAFRSAPHCVELFLELLASERRVMRTLTAMNEVGLLGAFLPEWEHIVFRWQHVLYHSYTVDVHSIFLVEELRRLWQRKYEGVLPNLTELMRSCEDRVTLFLGCLLHDIGKGFGGNHSSRGAERARVCLDRLGIDSRRKERILFVVEHHLVMSHIAQRRDLSDSKLLLDFAQICGDRSNLRNLYLATFADIRASSRDAWTAWKGQLLQELYERTAEILETGATDSQKAMALIEARVETRREGAAHELASLGVGEEKVRSYFQSMPRRYFVSHTPRQIARHAQAILRMRPDQRFSTAYRSMRGGFTELILWARDIHGLYAMVTGTLAASGLNILGSRVYTARGGIALEVYRIRTPAGGQPERDLAWQRFEKTLGRVLRTEVDVGQLLERRGRPMARTRVPRPEPTRVVVSNDVSELYTVIDVSTSDRVGLLFDLTRTIGDAGLEIYISKAGTIRDQAADTFYVKDSKGKKLRDGNSLESLQRSLSEVIEGGEACND